jgi:hypothetical protein
MFNLIEVSAAIWGFRSYADNSIQQKLILPKEVHVFMVGEYSETLQLLADQQVFEGGLEESLGLH